MEEKKIMKKAIAIFIVGIFLLTSAAALAGAIPVLDSLYAWHRGLNSAVTSDSISSEKITPTLEERSLQMVDGQLIVCSTYTAHDSGIDIEVKTQNIILPAGGLPLGTAVIVATTSGHDTEGTHIYHDCKIDNVQFDQESPLQPSPSSYWFSQRVFSSVSRYVNVKGWIENEAYTPSPIGTVDVWVPFSLLNSQG